MVRIPLATGDPRTLEADFYTPSAPGPAPAVVMAHGFGAERSFGLAPVARSFQSAGLAVVVPDYRGFGGSDGEPRLLVDPRRHREDLEAVLHWLRRRDGVDPERVVLWGVSLGGGHALALAARDPELAGVIVLVPHVDGLASALTYPLRHLPRALLTATLDLLGSVVSAPPLRVPVVARDGFAALPGRDAWEGYRLILPEGVTLPDDPERPGGDGTVNGSTAWDGRVPARILLRILFDRPGRLARRIRVPVLVEAAEDDGLIPFAAVRDVARRIQDCEFRAHPMDHFGPYREEWWEPLMEEQLAFLRRVTG